jgi:hypothetical protein
MKPTVALVFDLEQDDYHASALYAGLDGLARRGVIRLRFRRCRGEADRHLVEDPLAVCLEVMAEGQPGHLLAIDLHDQGDVFAPRALAACDVYLKRSFHRPDVERLPTELARKVLPFGLNYSCRSHGSTMRFLRVAGPRLGLGGLAGLRRLRNHFAPPLVEEFEQDPTTDLERAIILQTRVWEPHDAGPGEAEAINEGRVALIRALRAAFGDRFQGGLVRTPLALARYPQEISPHPSRRRLYTAMSKRYLIGVYTRGLHESTAFKLPEYLAASQCVVAEPPRNELPVPLEAGKHFLPFRDPDECVAACRRLLADDDLVRAMRQANHEYYRSEVEPAEHVARVLERSLATSRVR